MAPKDFHDESFDAATLLKLELYSGYVREWIPVFLNDRSRPDVHIYDFFAGPGKDPEGKPGSPLLILDELDMYLDKHPDAARLPIFLHFNDADSEKVHRLKLEVEARNSDHNYSIEFSDRPFAEAFELSEKSLRTPTTANLVIIDQCGVKDVTEAVFKSLTECPKTDLLFFLPSDFVKRFIDQPSFRNAFPRLSVETVRDVPAKEVHRLLCRYYRGLVPHETAYYLSPFSIEKERTKNIYGIIFGSGSLFGLDKFLKVCWSQDQVTGEANYNIDDDAIRYGQYSLFAEDNVVKKQDRFQRDLLGLIRERCPDNHDVYRFALENGFTPTRTREVLDVLVTSGSIEVVSLAKEKHRGKRIYYYLRWEEYDKNAPRVRFVAKEHPNEN